MLGVPHGFVGAGTIITIFSIGDDDINITYISQLTSCRCSLLLVSIFLFALGIVVFVAYRMRILSTGARWSLTSIQFSGWRNTQPGRRHLSVKELPWCSPSKSSPNQKCGLSELKIDNKEERLDAGVKRKDPPPIESFGIVAAMSENRVIGLNGAIPWPRCAEDRQNFKDLTKDKILIIGRRTYEEEPNQRHICHAKECIVVSRSLTQEQLLAANADEQKTRLVVVKSLPEALGLAKETTQKEMDIESNGDNGMQCWVAGGERIYEEAMRHTSAKELHLTTMHLTIDVEQARQDAQNLKIDFAMFPSKHRWDRFFSESSRAHGGGPSADNPDCPRFTYIRYERQRL